MSCPPKKSDRIAMFVESLGIAEGAGRDPRFVGFFECFNRGDYYEAHDVLEDLWLATDGPDREFYKALIQIAGAFVHLRKQWENPDHPHHGRRLMPASRIFHSAIARIGQFAPAHHGVDVDRVLRLCRDCLETIRRGACRDNPWHPEVLPRIELDQ